MLSRKTGKEVMAGLRWEVQRKEVKEFWKRMTEPRSEPQRGIEEWRIGDGFNE